MTARPLAFLVCVAGWAFCFGGSGVRGTQPATERVVFAWEQNGNIDLFMAATDGSDLRRLTHHPEPDELPRCSRDGRELLFRRGGAVRGELVRLDLVTLHEQRLTSDDVRDSNPQWSLDGRTVYATKRIGGFDRIVSFDRDGRQMRVLSPERDWHDVMPSLSADGRRLVFHTYRYGKEADLQVVELEGFATHRLTEAPGNDYEPVFAGPDAVVFSSNRAGGHYRLYFQRLTGSEPARLLADTGADAWSPRYSPASRTVLFYTGKPGAWRMMTVAIDGGQPRPFLDDGTSKSSADWCAGSPR